MCSPASGMPALGSAFKDVLKMRTVGNQARSADYLAPRGDSIQPKVPAQQSQTSVASALAMPALALAKNNPFAYNGPTQVNIQPAKTGRVIS